MENENLPVEGGQSAEKWFLASTTVRSILIALIPTIRTVMDLFQVELQSDALMSLIDGVAIICGVGSAVYLWMKRQKRGKLTFLKPMETAP